MATYLFNPFKFIAGGKALGIGWTIMLATICIAFLSRTHFDGVIDAHYGLLAPFAWYILETAMAWGCTVICFYPAALLFSTSSVRLIDMAGTMALARAPMLCTALIFLAMPPVQNVPIKTIHDIDGGALLIGLAATVFSIWMIALMFHAFRVSANLKGRKATWVFIVALVIAELLSQFMAYLLYRHIV